MKLWFHLPEGIAGGFITYTWCACVLDRSVVSDSLRPHGLWPTKFFYPWDFPGKSPVAGYHFLLQGIFPTEGFESESPTLAGGIYQWAMWEALHIAGQGLKEHTPCVLQSLRVLIIVEELEKTMEPRGEMSILPLCGALHQGHRCGSLYRGDRSLQNWRNPIATVSLSPPPTPLKTGHPLTPYQVKYPPCSILTNHLIRPFQQEFSLSCFYKHWLLAYKRHRLFLEPASSSNNVSNSNKLCSLILPHVWKLFQPAHRPQHFTDKKRLSSYSCPTTIFLPSRWGEKLHFPSRNHSLPVLRSCNLDEA